MLEIMPVGNKEFHRRICSDLKIEYVPSSLAYCAVKKNQILALCQLTLNDKRAELKSFDAVKSDGINSDRIAKDLLLAVLSFLDAYNVKTVVCHKDIMHGLPTEYLPCFVRHGTEHYHTEINGFFNRTSGNETD